MRPRPSSTAVPLFLPVLPLLLAPTLSGQELPSAAGGSGWNAPEVLELVQRARGTRASVVEEGELETYRALTDGHIYFFVDPEEGERSLIRIDQVAVELRWQAPDRVQQHILGERSETRLPVRDFRYYLDRLTLVQHGFGDEIRVGSGLDVAGVPHPLAPLPAGDPALAPYDYRLADSLSITLPGRPDPVRIYEVEVRPRDPSRPAIVGTVALDRATAGIVRMDFTFTPASYMDRRTDRISVELEHGLWEGRHWLPHRQEIEVRRELPEVDLGVGTVIRAVLRVGGYELNVPLPPDFHSAPPVTAASREARERFEFREGLFEGIERDGLADLVVDSDPGELRARATELLRDQPPSGLAPFRLHLPRASSGIRYNRVEGLYLGLGGSLRPRADLRVRAHGGYAFGEDRPGGTVRVELLLTPEWSVETTGRLHALDDLGIAPGMDALLSGAWAAFRGEDFQDPYRVSGADVRLVHRPDEATRLDLALGAERHRRAALHAEAAPFDGDRPFREVRPVTEGDFLRGEAALRRTLRWPLKGRGTAWGELGARAGGSGSGVGLRISGEGRWGPLSGRRDLKLAGTAWSWWGDPLPQGHRLLGGRGTLPGFPYRSFVGRHAVISSLVGSTDLVGSHLRLRAGLHGGWADGGAETVAEAWAAGATGGVRLSASLGIGFAWDLIRVDLARGINGGEWQLLLSLDPRWWDRL